MESDRRKLKILWGLAWVAALVAMAILYALPDPEPPRETRPTVKLIPSVSSTSIWTTAPPTTVPLIQAAPARPPTTAARPRVPDSGRASRSGSHTFLAPGTDPFDALAACDCCGDRDGKPPHRINPTATSPTGKYLGAFQFDLPTWRGIGETGDPRSYSYERQKQAAIRLQKRSSWGQWPDCSRRLGLR